MILKADSTEGLIKLDDIILPGIFQNLSVNGEIIIDSNNSVGNNKAYKVMRGFRDKTINASLVLLPIVKNSEDDDSLELSVYEQLEELEKIFRRLNNGVPKVFTIANEHILSRGITQVVFKGLSSTESSASGKLEISLAFEEFIQAEYDGSK